jgi:hypothetical protein
MTRIRILVWLYPWIFTLDYGSESGSCSLLQWLSICHQKWFFQFFCLFLAVGTFTTVLKDYMVPVLRSHKMVEIMIFVNFVEWWWKDPNSEHWLFYSMKDMEKVSVWKSKSLVLGLWQLDTPCCLSPVSPLCQPKHWAKAKRIIGIVQGQVVFVLFFRRAIN